MSNKTSLSTPVLSSGFSWTCLQTQCNVWRVPERWPIAAPGSDAGSSDPAARLWRGWRRRAGWRSRTDSCGCCSSCSAASCGKTRRLRNQRAQIKHSQLDDITFYNTCNQITVTFHWLHYYLIGFWLISVTFYSFSKSFYPKSKEIRNTTSDFSLGNNMRRASNTAPSLSRIVQEGGMECVIYLYIFIFKKSVGCCKVFMGDGIRKIIQPVRIHLD